jgi:hypothetical protein
MIAIKVYVYFDNTILGTGEMEGSTKDVLSGLYIVRIVLTLIRRIAIREKCVKRIEKKSFSTDLRRTYLLLKFESAVSDERIRLFAIIVIRTGSHAIVIDR